MSEVARRTFERTREGKAEEVVLTIKSVRRDRTAWRCDFEITGGDLERSNHAYGEDGVQALIIGFRMAATLLYCSEAWKAGELTWLGNRDLGLPTPDALRDIAPPGGV